jgi:hypothetical protein
VDCPHVLAFLSLVSWRLAFTLPFSHTLMSLARQPKAE